MNLKKINLELYTEQFPDTNPFKGFIYDNKLAQNPEEIKIIFNLPYLIRRLFSSKGIVAITFRNYIFFSTKFFDGIVDNYVVHELVHVKQYKELGTFRFLYRYIKEMKKGYRFNSFEVEAYNMQYSYMDLV